MSLATLHALSNSAEARAILESKDRSAILEVLESTGALDYATRRTREYSEGAVEELAALKPSSARDGLAALAEFAVNREE